MVNFEVDANGLLSYLQKAAGGNMLLWAATWLCFRHHFRPQRMTIADLPSLNPEDEKVLALLEAEPPSHFKHCFRSALNHLSKAYAVSSIDPEMAIFRATTAEEEAASGLMRSLMQLRYPGCEELQAHDHIQKHAVTPFIQAVLSHLSFLRFQNIAGVRMAIKNVDGNDRLVTVLRLMVDGDEAWALPIPPLNVTVRDGKTGESPTYTVDFQRVIEPKGYRNIKNYLKREANLRNRVLYAGPDGYPVVEDLDSRFILERQTRVLIILKVALLISPYAEHQPFVTSAISAFLRMTNRLSSFKPKNTEA